MKLKLVSAFIIAALVMPLTISEVSAQSACQGKPEAGCKSSKSCSWVGPHKRGGKDVKGYCRMSGKSAKASKRPARKGAKTSKRPAKTAKVKRASRKKATKKRPARKTTKKTKAAKKPAKAANP